ncbi:Histone-lysine N-methyltransferase SETMAR [Araneus ventricosus]|uniref:Histone-lysine N-methyltransferase SETMAR n=1 Tax=Araneus ventricosus TaxID=182803 RepID=A0A4Y2AQ39_ARAVE|nr:Histone-lysine N-methyltransferase SETMAR [Araneus ventricosus]
MLVNAVPFATIRENAVKSNSTVLDDFKRFGKSKEIDKRVPRELREKEKDRPYEVCSALVLCDNGDPSFFYSIGTCDKKWIVCNSWRYSAQWLNRGRAPQHFPKPTLHQRKTVVAVWYF